MTMNEKFCVNCRYYHFATCERYAALDLVTGKRIPQPCSLVRYDSSKCSVSGVGFEPMEIDLCGHSNQKSDLT